ncbi:MAG: hypothetical protein IJ214_12410 [Clostridia bacterium]|nr:hypothetical protein [Clostridia bacterium]
MPITFKPDLIRLKDQAGVYHAPAALVGPRGPMGETYNLTDADRSDIAGIVEQSVQAVIDRAEEAASQATASADKLEHMTATAAVVPPGTTDIDPTVTQAGGHYRIAFKVPQGNAGDAAVITNTETVYQNSAEGTALPQGDWLSSQPSTPQGQFLWTRTTLTWNSGQTTALYGVSRQGVDGEAALTPITEAEINTLTAAK